MILDAATCDGPGCLAIFLRPADLPDDRSMEDALAAAGWRQDLDGHICPGCATGTGPVIERGECPRCCGSTVDLATGARCHYCGHLQPHPDGEDDILIG
jgi:hypothetical protein